MTQARSWRTSSAKRSKGRYWVLRAGSGQQRRSLTLGFVSEAQARSACDQMNQEEGIQRAERVLDWHAENKNEAIQYLLGDPAVAKVLEDTPDFRNMRLRVYFEEHFSAWRAEAAPGGWYQERRVWTRVLPVLGALRLCEVDAHAVADYLDELRVLKGARKGKPASGNVRRLHRAAIQALLKRAYRLKHIDVLPDLAVFPIKGATRRVVEKPDPLSLKELVALLKVSPPKFRAMWATGAGQGLRPSELNRIRWEDVDLDGRTLWVRGTKTSLSAALVPLTPLALRELRRWWEACERPAEGLLFPSPTGKVYGPQGWKKSLQNAAKAAGIGRRVYPYLLRDSFATISWMQGIPLELAKRITRHAPDSKVLEQVYCRPRAQDIARKLAAFDAAELE